MDKLKDTHHKAYFNSIFIYRILFFIENFTFFSLSNETTSASAHKFKKKYRKRMKSESQREDKKSNDVEKFINKSSNSCKLKTPKALQRQQVDSKR
jgi:hypothetical protein